LKTFFGKDTIGIPSVILEKKFCEDLFRDHTNPMRKKGKILVKTFFLEKTLYIWKCFVLNILADSLCLPPPQKKNCFALRITRKHVLSLQVLIYAAYSAKATQLLA